ncbi:S-layer homology domain-containing protein [Saccharibacillus sp. JS10]|uniref:S-layer homology domain-containing protein n=1 Tax=Saccharibacillus sp. JS10 TaxID=2950552 RepID=UPI00210EA04A|nr:S-layer homology domain-containing protein [Saccharibacillus sp. JS10]MCQ4088036.1 S-layer homology domain-containing protein [Saccharibacillus sp. JS10]
MEKRAQQRTWKSWFSGLMAIVLLVAMFPLAPDRASAAGTLTVTSSNPNAVAGDTVDINVTYTNSAVLTLNLGALDYILPAGIRATTNDQINGVNLTASQILDNGQRVRLSGLSLSLLQSNMVLSLRQKTLPTSGTYNFESRIYGLTLGVINTTPSETTTGSVLVSALTLPLSSITATNNSGNADVIAVSNIKANDIVKIYNTDGSLRTQLTANADGTLNVPVTLTPTGGSVGVSLTRGGIESARVQVSYLAEIVPPIALTSIYISNQSGNADSVTVNNLTAGDRVRLYTDAIGGTELVTSTAVPSGQTSIVIPTTLTPAGGTLYVARVQNGLESARTPVVYLPEVVAALTSNLITITNASGDADIVRVTGLTPGDVVRVYASTDGITPLQTLQPAGANGIAQGTVALTPGGGTVYLSVLRNGIESVRLPVVYVAEVVRSLLASDVTIQNNGNDTDFISVNGLREGDRIIVDIGTGTPITSDPADGSGSVNIPATLLPSGGSVTLSILRNTIEGPKLTLLYDPERVDAPAASSVNAVNNSGNSDTVTVNPVVSGDEVIVYDSPTGSTVLGRTTATSTTATVSLRLKPEGGTAYVAIQRRGNISSRTAVTYNAETVAAPALADITVVNGTRNTDSVTVRNLQANDQINVYAANGTTLLGTAPATLSGGAYSATLAGQTLTPTGGNVQVSITRNTIESPKTLVSYNAEVVNPPALATITVVNNVSPLADTIAVNMLQSGDIIRVYQGSSQTPTEFTVGANSTTVSGQLTLDPTGGTLRVSVVRNGVESTTTSVAYVAENPDFNGSVSVINAEGTTNDLVNFSNLASGTTVQVFGNATGTGTPVSGTVGINGTLSLAASTLTLNPAGGQISFRFTPPNSAISNLIVVDYLPEPVSPPSMDSIVPVNNTGNANDRVTISQLRAGDVVNVYVLDENGTSPQQPVTQSATTTDGSNYSAVVNTPLIPAGGAVEVSITRNTITSDRTRVNYSSEVVDPPAIADIIVTNDPDTNADSVQVNNLLNNDEITVISYTANGTEIDRGNENSGTGNSATVNLDLVPAGGYVTVAITRNTITSAATRVNHNAETVPPPAPTDITVTNGAGTAQDTVAVSGLRTGDYVEITTYDRDNTLINTYRVAAQGTTPATATANVDLAPAGGYVTAAIVRYSNAGAGGVTSAATSVSYNAEVIPPPAVGTITVTNNTGNSDTVSVNGLQSGDEIRIYNADGSERLATAPATVNAVNGIATATVQLIPGGGTVRVTIVRNTLESASTQATYGSEVVAAPLASNITVVNGTGSADSVTVSGLQVQDLVTVTNGTATWTGTVTSGNSVQIPVELTPEGGVVQVKITRNTIDSPATAVPYSAEVVPAPSASNITVSNVANNGTLVDTVTVVGVTAGDTVRVYDPNYNVIGTAQATGASVTINIPDNLVPTGGSLYVAVERNGILSSYVPVTYAAETVEPIDIAQVSATNAIGNNDTLTVGGLNSGDTLRVYRANGSVLTFTPSQTDPSVFTTTFNPNGETLTLVRVRNGIESTGVTFNVGAQNVPTVDANSVTVVNNTGAQDTVTIAVAAADYEAGDAYIVYDEGLNQIGRSTTYSNGNFVIPVTLVPGGGTVSVALERGTVVGQPTPVPYAAETPQPNTGPAASDITVTNGETDEDPVVVDNVIAGDVVIVYATDGTQLGTATATADGSITVLVNLDNATGGTIEVAIVRDGNESTRTPQTYAAYDPDQPPVPEAAQVTVVRSADPDEEDVVTVSGLVEDDEVQFFDDENTNIGEATANDSGVAVLRTLRLKSYASTLKLNVTRAGVPSGPLAVSYAAETSTVTAPTAANITVNNAAGTSNDTVTVTGVTVGDRVRVYASNGTTLLGEIRATGTTAIVPVQLGAPAGSVRVSIVRGTSESPSTLKSYLAEPVATPAPAAADITVVNARGTTNDSVTVTGVTSGDIVRVYAADGTTELGERTATGSSVVIPVALGASAGTVNVSVERGGFESPLTQVSYGAEVSPTPNAPAASSITVTNDAGTANDQVTVENVQSGDIVRIYEAGVTNPIGQATATATSITIPVVLKSEGGSVTVTIERAGAVSPRSAAVTYPGDPVPPAPAASNITVTNATGNTADRVVIVEDVQAGDLVRVYNANGTTELGQMVSSGTTVEIPVELNASGGSVRVTIERGGVQSVLSAPVSYGPEPAPAAPATDAVSVFNRTGTANDEVRVATGGNVQVGDIIRVYAANGTTLLGQRTAVATSTSIPVALNAAGGAVQVRIERNDLQSNLTGPINYGAEPAAPSAPSAPLATDIAVFNRTGNNNDQVEVENVEVGDIVRVYGADGTTLLGQHTATTTTTLVDVILDPAGGSVRVRIERGGLQSALSAPVTYTAEPAGATAPTAPATADITVNNETGTNNDSVVVDNVVAGDIVRVYAADGTTLLGQYTATSTTATVAVILNAAGGTLQVRIERDGLQSPLSNPVTYAAEPAAPTAPEAPVTGEVDVDNQPGTANDTVTVRDVEVGDLVRVYSADGTRVLGQGVVSASPIVIAVELETGGGTVAVSISRGELESGKLQVPYNAESIPSLDGADFATTVYSDGTGTVVVTDASILAGDVVVLNIGGVEARGTAQFDGSVTVTVASGLDATGGSFTAVRERDGIPSNASSPIPYDAAATGSAPTPSVADITYDRVQGEVTVANLQEGDIVTVTVGGQSQTGTVGTGDTSVTVNGFNFADQGGRIEVSVQRDTDTGSPVTVLYDAVAPQQPANSDITINNNVGSADAVIIIDNVQQGDHFIVYAADGVTILGQATATSSSPVTIPVALDPAGGSVQVSVTRYGLESDKVSKNYDGETPNVPQPALADITVTNNTGNADTVEVDNLQANDTVTVYNADGSAILGKETATSAGSLTIPVTLNNGSGNVQVSITRGGTESAKTTQSYTAEPGAVAAPAESDIEVTNNAGNNDTVQVDGLQPGDVVTIYSADGQAILGKETATGSNLTINLTLLDGGGDIQVSITRGTTESAKTEISYESATSTVTAPVAADITVNNNTGNNDTVEVANVQNGDIVTVYNADGTAILARVTAAENGTLELPLTLSSAGGNIRVSISRGNVESAKTSKSYDAEVSQVPQPQASNITATNNTGNGDTVKVDNVQVGDVITVYAANGTTVLGVATATTTSVTLNVVLDAAGGSVQVAITRGNVQSAKTPQTYPAESNNVPAPSVGNVVVTNNLGSQDSVRISNVQVGDTYTIYARNGRTILARATATEAGTLTIPLTLPEDGGEVEVTVTRGNVESASTPAPYQAAPTTINAPSAANITVSNNTGNADTVTLRELQAGDTITIYAANGTTILNRVTVGSDPATWVIPVTLNPNGGSVQVSINRGGVESATPTTVTYGAEPTAVPAPAPTNVAVNNNGAAGSSVVISNVQPGDIITIYAANGTTVIGRGQVAPGATSITIPVSLNEAGGNLQVTLTRGATQSAPTPVVYPARIEGEQPNPGTGGGGGGGDAGGGTPAPTPTNPVTPETNPVTPESEGDGEDIDVPGRIVTLTMREPRTFSDISGYWAQSAIERLAALGVIDGHPNGTFKPRETLSRAQFTKMIATLLDIRSQNTPIFTDTPVNRWYTTSIQGAYEQGIVDGYTGGNFDPDEPITREEMAKVLNNAMLWLNPDVFPNTPNYTAAQSFRDYNRVGNWAKEPVSRMLEEGIMIGKTNGILDPKGNATRAEAATVLVRLLERMSDNFTS